MKILPAIRHAWTCLVELVRTIRKDRQRIRERFRELNAPRCPECQSSADWDVRLQLCAGCEARHYLKTKKEATPSPDGGVSVCMVESDLSPTGRMVALYQGGLSMVMTEETWEWLRSRDPATDIPVLPSRQ